MKSYWVRFYDYSEHLRSFEYHGPWWVTGFTWDEKDEEMKVLCAAVRAESEEAAQRVIIGAYDNKDGPAKWSFVDEQDTEWDPKDLGDRFVAKEWMKWPWPTEA